MIVKPIRIFCQDVQHLFCQESVSLRQISLSDGPQKVPAQNIHSSHVGTFDKFPKQPNNFVFAFILETVELVRHQATQFRDYDVESLRCHRPQHEVELVTAVAMIGQDPTQKT